MQRLDWPPARAREVVIRDMDESEDEVMSDTEDRVLPLKTVIGERIICFAHDEKV